MANSEWMTTVTAFHYSLLPIRNSPFAYSPLHQRAVIEPAVEPVLIARDVLLHRDVDEGLIQRNARNIGEGQIDKTLHVRVVSRHVAAGSRGAGAVDQSVHLRRLVAHGIEDGIVAVIAPV